MQMQVKDILTQVVFAIIKSTYETAYAMSA